jgi:hypothetical protein
MTAMDAYDITTLGGVTSGAYGDVPSTIVSLPTFTDANGNVNDSQGLFITSVGGTFWDYVLGAPSTATCSGFSSWADVAGGAAIAAQTTTGNSGAWWVVGGTRATGAPTGQVLYVDPSCAMTGLTLNSPRLGAAAAWIENVGLVVAGGTGDATSTGLEVLPMGNMNSSFTAVPYPPDPIVGGSLIAFNGLLLLVGGVRGDKPADPAFLSPVCTTPPCTYGSVAMTPALPPLRNTTAFQLSASQALLVGTDDTGMTQTFVLDVATMKGGTVTVSVTPAPLREPRRGATAILSPVGSVAMIGGEHQDGTPALSVELFAP